MSLAAAEERPNILWITTEDNGQELGCYGDSYVESPNIDALAGQSLRYRTAWSNAPVCAPARTTIIISHESQIRSRPHTLKHDPDKAGHGLASRGRDASTAGDRSPREFGLSDDFSLEFWARLAFDAIDTDSERAMSMEEAIALAHHRDSVVRYGGIRGIDRSLRADPQVKNAGRAREVLAEAMRDESSNCRQK